MRWCAYCCEYLGNGDCEACVMYRGDDLDDDTDDTDDTEQDGDQGDDGKG